MRVVLDQSLGTLRLALMLNSALLVQQQDGPLELMPLTPRGAPHTTYTVALPFVDDSVSGNQAARTVLCDVMVSPDDVVVCPEQACFLLRRGLDMHMYTEQERMSDCAQAGTSRTNRAWRCGRARCPLALCTVATSTLCGACSWSYAG